MDLRRGRKERQRVRPGAAPQLRQTLLAKSGPLSRQRMEQRADDKVLALTGHEFAHTRDAGVQLALYLEVPQTQDPPPECFKSRRVRAVALDVPGDLVIPELTGPTGLVARRVSMPERAIHKHS